MTAPDPLPLPGGTRSRELITPACAAPDSATARAPSSCSACVTHSRHRAFTATCRATNRHRYDFARREPRRGVAVALLRVGRAVDREQVERSLAKARRRDASPLRRTLLPRVRQRHHVVDLHRRRVGLGEHEHVVRCTGRPARPATTTHPCVPGRHCLSSRSRLRTSSRVSQPLRSTSAHAGPNCSREYPVFGRPALDRERREDRRRARRRRGAGSAGTTTGRRRATSRSRTRTSGEVGAAVDVDVGARSCSCCGGSRRRRSPHRSRRGRRPGASAPGARSPRRSPASRRRGSWDRRCAPAAAPRCSPAAPPTGTCPARPCSPGSPRAPA